jgi:predicted phosphoribosyltransferase
MSIPFSNRREAGRHLAEELARFATLSPLVLALPRGGVPVAYEVAQRLRARLDVFLVRKLGAPHHPELAIGAIASGGATVLNHETLEFLHVSERELHSEVLRQRSELERRAQLYRENAAPLELRDEHLIIVDDGFATGASMRVAVEALRQSGPRSIVAAAPVGAPEACDMLAAVADEVVCLETPASFRAVGLWYQDFEQTSDQEVIELLASGRRARGFAVHSSAASSH